MLAGASRRSVRAWPAMVQRGDRLSDQQRWTSPELLAGVSCWSPSRSAFSPRRWRADCFLVVMRAAAAARSVVRHSRLRARYAGPLFPAARAGANDETTRELRQLLDDAGAEWLRKCVSHDRPLLAPLATGLLLCGCGDHSMTQQRRYGTFTRAALFENGREAQPLPDGVVAQGDLERAKADAARRRQSTRSCWRAAASATTSIALRAMGCAGNGDGMIVQRGFPAPPSYHIARLRAAPAQHYLRRDHQWLRGDVLVRSAGRATRPLGDRRLYPGAAAIAARECRGCSRAAEQAAMTPMR